MPADNPNGPDLTSTPEPELPTASCPVPDDFLPEPMPSTAPDVLYPHTDHRQVRYRFVRRHREGGLGEVSVAFDEELGRQVALKRIQARWADDQGNLERFEREARITALLQHPGVVPIHALATDSDGYPCYVMRFVEGETLNEAIRRFHEGSTAFPHSVDANLMLRQLLGHFVAVCKTIAYAHSRQVIHRDVKPSNIMLGQYGETLVVDWGLAKQLAGNDSREAVPEGLSAASAVETSPDVKLGTLGYRSPEQAAGHLDQMGPLSDVYSLARRCSRCSPEPILTTKSLRLPWQAIPGSAERLPHCRRSVERRWRDGPKTAIQQRRLSRGNWNNGWPMSQCERFRSRYENGYCAGHERTRAKYRQSPRRCSSPCWAP